jgi:hypothetical protein
MEYIVSAESEEKSQGGVVWFYVVYCDQCGHVYGVFAKHVTSSILSSVALPHY